MGRDREVQNPKRINFDVEAEDYQVFESIAIREHGGDKSKLGRKIIAEYNKAHGEGNDIYPLDNWNLNPEFVPIPSLMDPVEKLLSYVEKEDIAELKKVKVQHTIFGKMLDKQIASLINKDLEQTEAEKQLGKQRRNDNFRRRYDIRNRDPRTLSWNELQRYNQIMEYQKGIEASNNQIDRQGHQLNDQN